MIFTHSNLPLQSVYQVLKVMKKRLYKIIILAGCVISQSVFASTCEQSVKTHIWISPRVITGDEAVNVMAVSSTQPITDLVLTHPNGDKEFLKVTANSGQPWSLSSHIDSLADGNHQIEVQNKGESLGCRLVFNGDNSEKQSEWDDSYEAFYAAWIEQLFDSPTAENLSFPSLEPVIRDENRNFLHNYLGLNEDKELPANTDCADLPYFLRSYFAWKNGLLFSFRRCDRGTSHSTPACTAAEIKTDFVQKTAPLSRFKSISYTLMNAVHSGNTRTAAAYENSDFYPVALQREVLWPGTIYADPFGHVLMLVKWIEQTSDSEGILFAVDAEPDYSMARRRFWEGTFLFANTPAAASGFKAFRPIAKTHALLTNAQLPRYSKEQETLLPEEFYTRIGKLINPKGLDAKQAYGALLTALVEQLETRVQSIEKGEDYFRQGGSVIQMPDIPQHLEAIFETNGSWEDYATPSRDIRILNAINILLRFPDKIILHPEMFNVTAQAAPQLKLQILQLHEQLIQQKKIEYTRSNGMPQELTVADVLARRTALEMGYNPNDCPEVRWGAKAGSEEYASCTRHASVKQIGQMTEKLRIWFHEGQRPPR